MKQEISAGAILFRKSDEILFLLLHYPEGHWDFPKGHIESGETTKQTLKREIFEETGINNIQLINGYEEEISYKYKMKGELIDKKVIFFLAETNQEKIKLSFEHTGYEWLAYDKAIKKLTFENAKQLLEKANQFLKQTD